MTGISWNGLFDSYSKSFSRRNYSRVASIGYEFDDLYHDCYIVFERCRQKNPNFDRKRFMGYYKTALTHMLNELGKINFYEQFKRVELTPNIEDPRDYANEATFGILIEQAPLRIKKTIETAIEINGISNTKLCGILGYDPRKIDLIGETVKFLRRK